MRYSIEPRDRKYSEWYGILSFAKSAAKKSCKKYGKTVMDTATKTRMDDTKRASKNIVQKMQTQQAIWLKIR